MIERVRQHIQCPADPGRIQKYRRQHRQNEKSEQPGTGTNPTVIEQFVNFQRRHLLAGRAQERKHHGRREAGSILRLNHLGIELQRVNEIVAQFGLLLFDKKRRPFLRKTAEEAKRRPTDDREKNYAG